MNSSSEDVLNILIDASIIFCSSISLCLSAALLSFIVYHVLKTPSSPSRVALLLTGNMSLALLLFFIFMIDMYGRMLYGHLHLQIQWINNLHCQIHAYLLLVSIGSIFYSNMLQAIYRLCRVVFHTHRFFQSYRFYIIAMIIQWLFCALSLLPILFAGEFKYVSNEYHCQIPYNHTRTAFITATLLYLVPILVTVVCYIHTLRRIRSESNIRRYMTHVQLLSARRDSIVLLRICVLFGLMILFVIPTVVSYLIFIIHGFNVWWASQVQWLFYALSMTSVVFVLAPVSPHVWNLRKKKKRFTREQLAMVERITMK